jgi:hypothetical protein
MPNGADESGCFTIQCGEPIVAASTPLQQENETEARFLPFQNMYTMRGSSVAPDNGTAVDSSLV